MSFKATEHTWYYQVGNDKRLDCTIKDIKEFFLDRAAILRMEMKAVKVRF